MKRQTLRLPLLQSTRALATLMLSVVASTAWAVPPDAALVQALDGIWQRERPAVSPLSDAFTRDPDSDPPRYSTPVKGAPTYLTTDAEHAEVALGRKSFPANESPWGPLPLLNTDDAELFEITLPKRKYQVISAVGSGLYGIGDWQRFGFLHVLDITNRGTPAYYPLVAEAGLREKVLGRLPGSAVLNYARLVPSRWASNTQVNAYEVLLYALKPKGAERVTGEDGRPLAYTLSRVDVNSPWQLERALATPVAYARDEAKRAYSAPPMRNALAPAPAATADAVATTAATPATGAAPTSAGTAATPASTATPATASTTPSEADAKKQARKEKSDARKKEAKDAATEVAKDTAKDAASDAAGDAVKKAIPSIR